VIVLLDNLESVMDTAEERLTEDALEEALETVLRAAGRPLKVLITARVAPTGLLEVRPEAQQSRWLDEGLELEDARTALRQLDPGGALGLESADGGVLNQLHKHTRGFPRAPEAIKGILAANRPKLTPQNLVERTRDLLENNVVEALVGQAYRALETRDQQVMQALAAAVGVDFLLQPYDPTVNTTPVLDRLVRWQLVRYDPGPDHYYLHPVDRDYAHDQIPRTHPDGADPAYTLAALQARAADYYAQILTPCETWHAIDHVFPQLAEFELRCDTGDYDVAATVLVDFDNKLQTWGRYRTVIELHTRLQGRLTDPGQNMRHLLTLSNCQSTLGISSKAVASYNDLLVLAQENNSPWNEAATLTGLGNRHYAQGNNPKAIELYTQALSINQEIGNRAGEATDLGSLRFRHADHGNYPKAIELHTQALTPDREIGNRTGVSRHLGNRGLSRSAMGSYPMAKADFEHVLAIIREIGAPYLEAAVLNCMAGNHAREGDQTPAVAMLEEALGVADTIGHSQILAETRLQLAEMRLRLGELALALPLIAQARKLNYPPQQQRLRCLEGTALLVLKQREHAHSAFSEAIQGVNPLLELAPAHVIALTAHTLSCCGLALTGDPHRRDEAVQDLAHLRAGNNNAAEDLADVGALLVVLATHNPDGILEPVPAALSEESQP
jgi:tetratricopeptide (TPR) repeat protein